MGARFDQAAKKIIFYVLSRYTWIKGSWILVGCLLIQPLTLLSHSSWQFFLDRMSVDGTELVSRDPPIMLKNFTYYAMLHYSKTLPIMFTEMEQFPDIYSTVLIHCLQIYSFIGN